MKLVFDIETNGLLDKMDRIHCIAAHDLNTGISYSWGPEEVENAVEVLEAAEVLIAHHGIGFDIPAIKMIYPDFKSPLVRDTVVMSRLIFPDLKERDFRNVKKDHGFPKNLIGSHGLKAWGYRLGNHKGDYDGGWENFSDEMMRYCEQDVAATVTLYERLMSKEPSDESLNLEHDVAHILRRQEAYGFGFDTTAAADLYATLLARSNALGGDLRCAFPPWEVRVPFTPKRDNKTRGYKKGVTVHKVHTVEFNPNSRDHIARCLTEKYQWKPEAFTPEGKPKIDEVVLGQLHDYPEAKQLEEFLTLTKRIGQLSTGPQAWVKKEVNGRIHGRVNGGGAVTGRMTHSSPNITQVPANGAIWGEECRALFIATPGKVLVGCDADGLEGRCLAGYMNAYDGGSFKDTILKGRKENGTDLHSSNAVILDTDRDTAKTWFYAFIYGAGVVKLGSILHSGAARGSASRKQFLSALPALQRIISQVKGRVSSRGYLLGLDKRRLPVRSDHAALNTLLQSAGAILMKRALVILDENLQASGYEPGVDYEFVANVHDEWQIETGKALANEIGRQAVQAIISAGKYYNFGCPLDANFKVGRNWSETH